jgi:hypothetical protein
VKSFHLFFLLLEPFSQSVRAHAVNIISLQQ